MTRAIRRLMHGGAAWAALVGIACSTLWPLLAGFNPGMQDPTGAEVCTARGLVRIIDRDAQLPDPRGPARRLIPHCAFCLHIVGYGVTGFAVPLFRSAGPIRHEAPQRESVAIALRLLFAPHGVRSPPV
jgi:hypothetical protein